MEAMPFERYLTYSTIYLYLVLSISYRLQHVPVLSGAPNRSVSCHQGLVKFQKACQFAGLPAVVEAIEVCLAFVYT
jgi:hypothetical protein